MCTDDNAIPSQTKGRTRRRVAVMKMMMLYLLEMMMMAPIS